MSHPAPEVAARPASAEEIPAAAARLLEAGQRCGWATGATYARGTDLDGEAPKERRVRHVFADPEQAGKQYEMRSTGEHVVVDSVVVRLQRAGVRLACTWVDGAFAQGWTRTGGRFTTSAQVIEYVDGVPHAHPMSAQELAREVREAMRPRKLKAGTTSRTHVEACTHVAQRRGFTLAQVGDALRAAGEL